MKQDLYKIPIVSSWGAVTLVTHEGLITPMQHWTVISLDENNVPIRPEDVYQNPFAANVKAVIVVTRRTGDPAPTEDEIKFCAAWKKAVEGLGAKLADYIIICGGSHYSFASERIEGPGPKGF